MAEITSASVKALRERTGLPMMDCKKALEACDGDADKAVEELRKAGNTKMAGRGDRPTGFGRMGLYTSAKVGAMVEIQCESAPVASNAEFTQLAKDLAQQLATGPGAATIDELLAQPSPSKKGVTLLEQRDELMNRIREVFNVKRMVRLDGACAGYEHPGTLIHGVLLQYSGGNDEAARNVCMHIAAMKPAALVKEELDPAVVAKERDFLTEQARGEGKPENIIAKMVEGRLRNFYAERVLTEQPYVKDDKQSVGAYAKANGMKIEKFVLWVLGKD